MVTVSAPVEPLTTIVSVRSVVARPQGVTPTTIRPALTPVPTAIAAESPAALMLTVAVPAAKPQLTAPRAGAAAPSTIARIERVTIVRIRTTILRWCAFRQCLMNPLGEPPRAGYEFAAAIGTDFLQRRGARGAERALIAANPRVPVCRKERTTALALGAHLEGHS